MDDLVSRLVDHVGLTEDQARRAVGIMFGFLKDAGPPAEVDRLMAALPGAHKVESPFDGTFGGPMGTMAAYNALTASGLAIGEIHAATREFVAYSKEKAGDRAVDEVIRALPGLNQFV